MILKGEHLFVTGGSAGIGEAIVVEGAKQGAKVSFVDIDEAKGLALVERLTKEGQQVQFAKADVSKFETFKVGYDKLVSSFGPVTIAVSNAGRNSYADPVEYKDEEWESFFALDLKSSWYLAKLCLPEMRKAKYGSIVNISSIHGRMSRPNFFPYSAAKGGIVGLSRNLALDEGKSGIRVNSVSPGYTLTPLLKSYMELYPEEKTQGLAVQPMKRFGTPEEVANVVTFVLSKDASYINGADLMIDGALHSRYA
jgi:NAD(P)-dependent dehydrogenase (short-subunit alcohol dehydrogenase family)